MMRKVIIFLLAWCSISAVFADLLPAVPTPTPVPASVPTPTAPTTPTPTATPAPAVLPANEASVTVADQSPTALQLGLQAAYSEVMVKMSGDANVMNIPLIRNASRNSTQWVQSYSYVNQTGVVPPQKPALMLNVVFNQNGMQQLLDASKLSQPKSALQNTLPTEIQLIVTGVKDMNDFTVLMQTLREQDTVSAASVINIDPDRIALNVRLTGTIAQFQTALSANHHFKAMMSNADSKTKTNELFYLWMGQSA